MVSTNFETILKLKIKKIEKQKYRNKNDQHFYFLTIIPVLIAVLGSVPSSAVGPTAVIFSRRGSNPTGVSASFVVVVVVIVVVVVVEVVAGLGEGQVVIEVQQQNGPA